MNGARFLLAILAGVLIGAAISGCPEVAEIGCQNPDEGHTRCGTPDPCHCWGAAYDAGVRDPSVCSLPDPCSADAGADGPTSDASADASIGSCDGQCLPTPPWPWSAPLLLAFSSDGGLPGCPPAAPVGSGAIYADLDAEPATCSPCGCEPSDGGCGLPTTITASTAASCPDDGPGAWTTPFDPPAGWDGGCAAPKAVAADTCAKGSTTCVQSITIAPLTVDEGCAVSPPQAPPLVPPIAWGTRGLVCTSGASGTCASLGETCGPAGADGFRQCVSQQGIADCPTDGPYAEQHVFFRGVDDARGCSTCTCGPVDGSSCSAAVSIFTSGTCSAMPLDTITVDATGPYCFDVPPGSALGSVSASAETYVSGTCQEIEAVPTGSAQESMPATFCCLPM